MNVNTLSFAEDKKLKGRKRPLQWHFTDRANETGNDGYVRHISDKRNVGVLTTNETIKTTAAGTGNHQGNNDDGLLGTLLLDHLSLPFFTAALGLFMPTAIASLDLTNAFDLADQTWMDRRTPKSPYGETSYYPL